MLANCFGMGQASRASAYNKIAINSANLDQRDRTLSLTRRACDHDLAAYSDSPIRRTAATAGVKSPPVAPIIETRAMPRRSQVIDRLTTALNKRVLLDEEGHLTVPFCMPNRTTQEISRYGTTIWLSLGKYCHFLVQR